MFVCDYEDRITIVYDKLCRVITATAKRKGYQYKTLDVYREFETGECECRNLYFSMYGGYRVSFPGDVDCYRNITELQFYDNCNKIKCFPCRPLEESEKDLIISHYPDFKYVLQKWNARTENVFIALSFWKEHKEIELMLAAGLENIALNKAFWKYTEKKRKEIVSFLVKSDERFKKLYLKDLLTVIKNKITYEDFMEYKNWFCSNKTSYDGFRYLQKKGIADYSGAVLYQDYKSLLRQTKHDKKSNYWLYPKDLQKKHDELREEVARINALKDKEKLKLKQEDYIKAVKKWLDTSKEIDGYSIFVPEDVTEFQFQAEYLHQCLISCDYVSKVIRKECVLVFIRKNDLPIATVQLLKDKKIGQFYADEHDRQNCLPSDEVRAVFNKWLMVA